ncbi:MAG: MAPEG family protein [Myxococcaceae bacterium]
MTLTLCAIFAAAVLPYAFLVLSGLPSRTERARWGSGYDNREARASLERLTGWRRRAHFAQLNGHEAFPAFAAAMGCATFAGVDPTQVHVLAGAFLGLRVAHGVAYVANRGLARSVLWSAAVTCVAALFVLAIVTTV